jgi:hypothetical protein
MIVFDDGVEKGEEFFHPARVVLGTDLPTEFTHEVCVVHDFV